MGSTASSTSHQSQMSEGKKSTTSGAAPGTKFGKSDSARTETARLGIPHMMFTREKGQHIADNQYEYEGPQA